MRSLILAAFMFFALRRFVSGSKLRDVLVRHLGERLYVGLFALASFATLTWMWLAYVGVKDTTANVAFFTRVAGLFPLQMALQLVAVLLVTLGLSTRNPTISGMERAAREPQIVHGVLRVTRHPFLWGMAIFAAGHMLMRPDLASWIFFGTLLIVASAGTLSIDAKRRRKLGKDWEAFARETSNLPFAAILRGRQTLKVQEIGLLRLAAVVGAYALLVLAHLKLTGVSLLP